MTYRRKHYLKEPNSYCYIFTDCSVTLFVIYEYLYTYITKYKTGWFTANVKVPEKYILNQILAYPHVEQTDI